MESWLLDHKEVPLSTVFKRAVQAVKCMHSVAAIATRTVSSCEPGTLPPLKHHLPDLPAIRSWCPPPYVLSVGSVTHDSAAARCLLVPCDRLAALRKALKVLPWQASASPSCRGFSTPRSVDGHRAPIPPHPCLPCPGVCVGWACWVLWIL